ncbi:hypothetical protein Tco_1397295 [Tanacetum coccineum]
MRRVGKGFSGREIPLFPIMMVQAQEEMGEDEAVYEDMDDILVRAATTANCLDAEQDIGNEGLGEEDASKQERIAPIDADARNNLEQAPTPTVSSQPPSQVKVQDKGKGKIVEPEPVKKMSKKDLLRLDEELAFKLQAEEEEEEERLAREKAQQVEEANIAWDDVQAKIKQRRKHFSAKRAEEKRNKPPTRAQKRSIMCTYLKNIEGWKPKSLKNKSFANIQELFDKAMKRVNTFVDYRTKLVEESSKKAESKIAH